MTADQAFSALATGEVDMLPAYWTPGGLYNRTYARVATFDPAPCPTFNTDYTPFINATNAQYTTTAALVAAARAGTAKIAVGSTGVAAEVGGFLGSLAKVYSDPDNAIGGVINGTYDAAIFGPTVLQAPLVMKLSQPIVSGMKTSFFRRPMILDRAAAMAMASATPAPTGGNPSMRSDKGDLDGYRAGIIVLALITFFLVIAVIVVAMRKPAVPVPVATSASSVVNPVHAGRMSLSS